MVRLRWGTSLLSLSLGSWCAEPQARAADQSVPEVSSNNVSSVTDDDSAVRTSRAEDSLAITAGPTPAQRADPWRLLNAEPTWLSAWSSDTARLFMATEVDLSSSSLRPDVSLGFGRPHQHWAGLQLIPILAAGGAGAYVGLRYRHPRFQIRSGALYNSAFSRTFLDPAASYDARDVGLSSEDGEIARYISWDSEMNFSLKLGYGYLFSETQSIVLRGVDKEKYVFVDSLGVIMAGRWAGRQRLGYTFGIPGVPNLYIAPAAEVVINPERPDSLVLRVGAIVKFWLYQGVELHTEVMPAVKSPDNLGRLASSWLTLGVRLYWATRASGSPIEISVSSP